MLKNLIAQARMVGSYVEFDIQRHMPAISDDTNRQILNLEKMQESYKENLQEIVNHIESMLERNPDNRQRDNIHQCLTWLRGELAE